MYAETTTAHATLTGLHYYHQDWFHAAAYVTVPPLRLDTNTSAYLMSLLAKYGSPGCSPRPLPACHALWAPRCQVLGPPPQPPLILWAPHSLGGFPGALLHGHGAVWVPLFPHTLLPRCLTPRVPCFPSTWGAPFLEHPSAQVPCSLSTLLHGCPSP